MKRLLIMLLAFVGVVALSQPRFFDFKLEMKPGETNKNFTVVIEDPASQSYREIERLIVSHNTGVATGEVTVAIADGIARETIYTTSGMLLGDYEIGYPVIEITEVTDILTNGVPNGTTVTNVIARQPYVARIFEVNVEQNLAGLSNEYRLMIFAK